MGPGPIKGVTSVALGTVQVALQRFRGCDHGQQALAGIRADQPPVIQPALLEVAQELAPEALGLTVAHCDPEHLAVAQGTTAPRRGLAAPHPSFMGGAAGRAGFGECPARIH